MNEPLEQHCRMVARQMARGNVVALLGAGANLCDRPGNSPWAVGSYLPSGAELAEHLASDIEYALPDRDLARVSEYFDLRAGEGPLYGRLREVFGVDYPPTSLHRFLAELPRSLEAAGFPRRHQLIVTTNYDDTLEAAFSEAGQAFDLVVYQAVGRDRGLFLHQSPDGKARLIRRPNEYRELSLEHRSVILKIHGTVNREDERADSYVITEDHYIEYLTHTQLSRWMPVLLLAKLLRSHFLFLGYALRDWNLRVILHRIWSERDLGYRSWAVQRNPEPVDQELWSRREVDIWDVPLASYVVELQRQIERGVAPPGQHAPTG